MKVQLIFDLPNEQSQYQAAIDGMKMRKVLLAFDKYLQNEITDNNSLTEDECHLLNRTREHLYDLGVDEGLVLC